MPVPMPFLARSLAHKLGLAVLVVALMLSSVAAMLLDREGSQAVDASTAAHMEVLVSALEGSFHVFDSRKNVHPVGDILAEIGRHPEVDSLQVFDHSGTIRHSLRPDETGTVLPANLMQAGSRALGSDELGIVRQFPPRSSCVACHQEGRPLGGVRMVVDRKRIQSALYTFRWRTGLTGAGIIAAVVMAVLILARRIIINPIRELVELMGNAETGDYLVRAPVRSKDEIGALAKAFNAMLAAITDMRAREVERQAEERNAEAELKWNDQLEEKNRIIAAQNEELQQRIRDLQLLGEVTRSITSTLSLDEQLTSITTLLADTLGYQEFTLMQLDRPAALLRVIAAHGFPAEMGVHRMTFQVGEGIAGLVAQTGETLLVNDTSNDPRYLKDKARYTPSGSLLCVPMVNNGQVLGVINVFKPRVDAFRKEEVDLIQNVAAQAALGIANATLFKETAEQAMTDALTETPNRRALDLRLEMEVARAQRYGLPLSVLMVDVDHFKTYNDAHGHLLGDGVLRSVAQTLRQMVRKTDTVARFGGEEFCLVLPGQDGTQAMEVGEKLRRAVRSRQFEHGETQPGGCVTVSVGVASFPGDGQDVQGLVDAADAALYAAKRAGRDRVVAAGSLTGGDGAKAAGHPAGRGV